MGRVTQCSPGIFTAGTVPKRGWGKGEGVWKTLMQWSGGDRCPPAQLVQRKVGGGSGTGKSEALTIGRNRGQDNEGAKDG